MLKFSKIRSGGLPMRKLFTTLLLLAFSILGSPTPAQQKGKSLTNDDFPTSAKVETQSGRNIRPNVAEKPPTETPPALNNWLNGAEGYAQALQEHRTSGKPMAVYFYTDWCGYCKLFNRDYLASRDVEQYMKNIIRVGLIRKKV